MNNQNEEHIPDGTKHVIPTILCEDSGTVSIPVTDQATKGNDEYEDTQESFDSAVAGLSVILGQMVAYFSGRASVDDMDVLSFSLHHLFCRADYLYRIALSELMSCSPSPITEQAFRDDLLRHQHIWTKLRAIKHTIDRMEPLCNLLSDATQCILDALDLTSEVPPSFEDPARCFVHHSDGQTSQDSQNAQNWLHTLNQERWEQALTTLTEHLRYWQQSYEQLAPFARHFGRVMPAIPALSEVDEVFSIVLDSAGAIFGDILPGFQAVSVGDDDAVATLLFDLMQQVDQLLVQFDKTLEPLHALIEHFAFKVNR